MKLFRIFTLGCKVNAYESEALKQMLIKEGYCDGTEKPNEEIHVVILNTCSVTSVSDQKSRQHIRHLISQYPNAIMVVMGCYTQMSSAFVATIEGVAIVVGTNNRHLIPNLIVQYEVEHKVINIVEDKKRDFAYENLAVTSFSETRAYIKIQDGCNNFCSYCIIPYARGQLRSRNKEDILKEVHDLVSNGFKEIVLTGIHSGGYGLDFENGYRFVDLIKDILKVQPPLERLRISSIEQGEINEEFIHLLPKTKVIANHFHMPLQSGCDTVLKRMNRKYDCDTFYNKLCEIRNVNPDIAITTDVIVGFPGESEEEFRQTYDFIKKCAFAGLHVFPFSARTGTPAAKMADQISPEIKKERVHRLLELSSQLENKYQSQFIGKELDVLFEEYDEQTGCYKGHSSNYILVHTKSNVDLRKKMIKVVYNG